LQEFSPDYFQMTIRSNEIFDKLTNKTDIGSISKLRIVLCSPEWISLQRALNGEPTNATYLIQKQIATRLQTRGHDITFITRHHFGQIICNKDINDLNFATLSWSGSFWFRTIKRLAWYIQKLLKIPYLNIFTNMQLFDACLQCLPGNDIVYERNGIYGDGIAMACKRLELPYILYVEADEILEYEYMDRPITGLLLWRAQKAFQYNLDVSDRIICVSKPLKEHLVEQWKIPAEKITVFPNGVDSKMFHPNIEARENIRESLGYYTDTPLLIFVGNFYEWHDVTILLDSFLGVQQSHPESRLILVGDGSTRHEMEEYADYLGITHAVQFTGLVSHNDVPKYITAADIAVVPYPILKDTIWLSPLKLFEYMASGKAIVASGVGQLLDVVQDGYNCLLVPPGNKSAMTEALLRLIDDDDLRERLGQHARDDAIIKHSWVQYITNLEELFANVILEKSR